MRIGLEWGRAGLAALAGRCDALVIVDVLSFSTCVEVACGRGAGVVPVALRDRAEAEAEAARRGAVLAGPRGAGGVSLSPPSLAALAPGARVVLPSPNGAALSAAAEAPVVIAGCLRNASAVARFLAARAGAVGIVAAGEHWPDGSLRPALEDLLGAGAIASALGGGLTADAEAARDAFEGARSGLAERLAACRSGRELIDRGYRGDVTCAAEHDVGRAVPLLRDGCYLAA